MAEILRIGAFFDGTGNNMWNDLAIGDASQTNVAKLYDLYKRQWKIVASPFSGCGGDGGGENRKAEID